YEKHPQDPEDNPQTWEHHKQTVVENIYGVDIVEPAVEIAKLRLWLSIIAEVDAEEVEEYNEDELALPNVVFNVQHGNSLVGYTDLMETNEGGAQMRIDAWGPDTVRAKYEKVIAEIRQHKQASNTRVAREHLLEAERLRETYRGELNERVLEEFEDAGIDGITPERVREFEPFHWVLEFAEVYARGGFDVVVGNPPWDVLSASRDDFFSRYDEQFRTYRPGPKSLVQESILKSDRIASEWERYKENVEAQSEFFKDSTEYELQTPTINGTTATYKNELASLFFERVFKLANSNGYIAQVLPGAIFNGQSSKDLRMKLLEECRVEALVEFENKGIFHEIDSRYHFGVV
ncbi:BREX-1 system adenine-specific DNA-methyltransferase PglX, partial [Halococcus sp. IIIV-5B]|uniref:BREX-1 system adenine-specific DNA-methyltransferase PglX n=1 Tax=Halococcus sp. IIIV-5B TaxID=2321230 RepID=UPI000EE308B5